MAQQLYLYLKIIFMKNRIFAVILFSFLGPIVQAQSMLKVSLSDKSPINISVDGRFFNKTGTSITVGDLPPGRHSIRIYAPNENNYSNRMHHAILDDRIKTFVGNITILVYDPERDVLDINEEDIYNYQNNQNNNQPINNNSTNNNNATRNDYNAIPPTVNNANISGTLNKEKTDNLKNKVADKVSDLDKVKVLQTELASEKITTAQVGEMMDWFVFESGKIEFVKWAYDKTIDKDNFGNLESKFSYKNYQDEFLDFIKSKK